MKGIPDICERCREREDRENTGSCTLNSPDGDAGDRVEHLPVIVRFTLCRSNDATALLPRSLNYVVKLCATSLP